ncbi:MAG: NmrA family NAD(P)-binding protein [Lewinellaceae bacterium]|nr:NmrA family NAD(P)-binding protein [Lewinellaceae bacterium]
MRNTILVAGGTGNLGSNIVTALLEQGAAVKAVVRQGTNPEKMKSLQQRGATVLEADMMSVDQLRQACEGVSCVVSALAGLREVIMDTQKVLLDAAVKAGVPRFIPSDYSLDFTPFHAGENRNLDWRREFHQYLDQAPIAATSIFNGAFADMLTGEMPMILFKQKRILYWGDADHKMAFTLVKDVAAYTALAAMDASTPRHLRIAGDYLSPREVCDMMSELSGTEYQLFRPGGPGLLSGIIKIARTLSPGKNDLYPAWQGMQYMRNMIDARATIEKFDNDRYPAMRWSAVKDLLAAHLNSM